VSSRDHWDAIYRTKTPNEVSWYQAEAALSLDLIRRTTPALDAPILDVGGGASTLVDGLLEAGYRAVTVLDIAPAGLTRARERLGARAAGVTWIAADVLTLPLSLGGFDVWHDRAVFHFLTRSEDRARYIAQARHAVRPGGHVIVASFAPDGPTRCSGLEVVRYSPDTMHAEFGAGFTLVDSAREEHRTPAGSRQAFTYCLCRVETPTGASPIDSLKAGAGG
jgi:SAM-dependent methyltransferase